MTCFTFYSNCTETNWDGQTAYEIFSTECRFWRFKPQFSGFKETCAWGHQRAYLWKSRYLTVVSQSFTKMVADHHGHAAYHKKNTSDELFSRINIDDFERPWTLILRGFYWFLWSSAVAHTPRMNCDEMARDRLTVCEQELQQAFAHLVSISSNFLLL